MTVNFELELRQLKKGEIKALIHYLTKKNCLISLDFNNEGNILMFTREKKKNKFLKKG